MIFLPMLGFGELDAGATACACASPISVGAFSWLALTRDGTYPNTDGNA